MKSILFSLFTLSSVVFLTAKSVVISPDIPIQEQFNKSSSIYEITKNVNLKGSTIQIPNGSTIWFRGGSITNGMLSGSFYVKDVKKGSMRVKLKPGSRLLSEFPAYNYSSDINVSILSSCVSGIILKENLIIDSSINLNTSIDGNNHSIIASSNVPSVLVINGIKKGISIKNLSIKREYCREINKNYAVICLNSSNVTISDCSIEGRLYFVNKASSGVKTDKSTGFVFRNCTLTCDLSVCPKGWQYGQDHIAFYSINNIEIDQCRIVSTNVNRVIKTSQYFSVDDYKVVSNSTDSLFFHNNNVVARSDYGKQMWDMYCGSTNIIIKNNSFELSDFTRFVENKAYQDKYEDGALMSSIILIQDNVVETSGSDLFQFRASTMCDSFEISGNTFIMGGHNKNPYTGYIRYCGGYLQGYKSISITNNSFKWMDDAIGLPFLMVNFSCLETVVKNNNFYDVYRININSGKHPLYGIQPVSGKIFNYSDNNKYYSSSYSKSREELYLSELTLDDLIINLEDNPFDNSYEVIFGDNLLIGKSSYNSKSKRSQPFYRNTK